MLMDRGDVECFVKIVELVDNFEIEKEKELLVK